MKMHPPSHNPLLLLLLLDLSSLTTPNLYLNRFNHRQKIKQQNILLEKQWLSFLTDHTNLENLTSTLKNNLTQFGNRRSYDTQHAFKTMT